MCGRVVSTWAETCTKESTGRWVRPRPVPCTPAATPASAGEGAGLEAGPASKAEHTPPRPRPGPAPGTRYQGTEIPPFRRQGDGDVTRAAGFGKFRRRRPLPGNARQARSQGQPLRGRLRTPVLAVLARPGSEPRSATPEGCRVPVLTHGAAPPGADLRARRLLPSRSSLSPPVSRVCPPAPIVTAIILAQATIHPPFRPSLP